MPSLVRSLHEAEILRAEILLSIYGKPNTLSDTCPETGSECVTMIPLQVKGFGGFRGTER